MRSIERNKNPDINAGKKQVIIVGDGFAGLQLVRNLDRRYFNVLLIDKSSMANIGRNKAIVDMPFLKFKGYPAWLVWMFLHLMLILSVRNKLIIFINWAWLYITKNTSLRLILTPGQKANKKN